MTTEHDPKSGELQHSQHLRSRGNFYPPDNRSTPYASEMSGEAIKPLGKPASPTAFPPRPIGKGDPGKGAVPPSLTRGRPPGFRKY
jgi:hypothetical protein